MASAIQQPAAAGPARDAVNTAIRAVEADSVVALRARSRATLAKDPRDATASLTLATLSRLTYDYADADRRFTHLAGDGSAPAISRTYARLGLGLSHASRWHFLQAGTFLSQAAQEARATSDRAGEVEALIGLLRLVARVGNPDSARALVARVSSLLPTSDPSINATSFCLLAGVARQASMARADSLLTLGRESAQRGHRRARGACQLLSAQVMEVRGQMARAVDTTAAAVDSLRRSRDSEWLATALQYQAYQGLFTLTFDLVRTVAVDAVREGARSGNVVAAGWAALNLAQHALRLGDVSEASRRAQRAFATLDSLGDRYGVANALFVVGDAAFLGGRFASAQRSFEQADSLYVVLGAASSRPAALYRLAALAREQRQPARAAALLDSVIAIATRVGGRGWLDVDVPYERGMQGLARGDWRLAIREFELFRRNVGNAPHYHYDARHRIAQALVAGGRLDSAKAVLGAAVTVGTLREFLADRTSRVTVLSGRRFDLDPDLGLASIVSGFVVGGRPAEALQIADARRARNLREQALRRLALVRDSVQARQVAGRRAEWDSLNVAAFRRSLPASTAALAYVTGRGREPTTLFVLTAAGIAAHHLPPADTLASAIRRFVSVVASGGSGGALARSLGQTLLDSALVRLGTGITRLVIVPDGPLHRLPFDALRLADGRLVLERYEVTLAPSLRVAQGWWESPLPVRPGLVVALGDPAVDRATGLPALPASRTEARLVGAFVRSSRVQIGAEASEHALATMDLGTVRVLHIAAHAQAEDWGILNNALYLSPGEEEDGRMGTEEIAQLQLDTELVVLSACRTLGGVVTVGEGLQGLVAPFLEAGARSVVATYWDMEDRALLGLMRTMYGELRDGGAAAAALRSAKLTALRSGAPASVWAGVAVYGDGGVRPLAGVMASK